MPNRPPPTDPQTRGRVAESLARRYLEDRGMVLETSNYRCRLGEIDLVMRHGRCLVFVEVRQRRNHRFGGAAESIDARKRRKLIAAARHYLLRLRHPPQATRFDVVLLEGEPPHCTIHWLQNAFEASD